MSATLPPKVGPDDVGDEAPVMQRCHAEVGVPAVGDVNTSLDGLREGGGFARWVCLIRDEALVRLAGLLQIDLDRPVPALLAEVEGVTVDRAPPLLGERPAPRGDRDACVSVDPRLELGTLECRLGQCGTTLGRGLPSGPLLVHLGEHAMHRSSVLGRRARAGTAEVAVLVGRTEGRVTRAMTRATLGVEVDEDLSEDELGVEEAVAVEVFEPALEFVFHRAQ